MIKKDANEFLKGLGTWLNKEIKFAAILELKKLTVVEIAEQQTKKDSKISENGQIKEEATPGITYQIVGKDAVWFVPFLKNPKKILKEV